MDARREARALVEAQYGCAVIECGREQYRDVTIELYKGGWITRDEAWRRLYNWGCRGKDLRF